MEEEELNFVVHNVDIVVPKNSFFGSPHNNDHSILGFMLVFSFYGKLRLHKVIAHRIAFGTCSVQRGIQSKVILNFAVASAVLTVRNFWMLHPPAA